MDTCKDYKKLPSKELNKIATSTIDNLWLNVKDEFLKIAGRYEVCDHTATSIVLTGLQTVTANILIMSPEPLLAFQKCRNDFDNLFLEFLERKNQPAKVHRKKKTAQKII